MVLLEVMASVTIDSVRAAAARLAGSWGDTPRCRSWPASCSAWPSRWGRPAS